MDVKPVRVECEAMDTTEGGAAEPRTLLFLFRWSTEHRRICNVRTPKGCECIYVDFWKMCREEETTPDEEMTAFLAPVLDSLKAAGVEASIGKMENGHLLMQIKFKKQNFLAEILHIMEWQKILSFGSSHTSALTAASALLLHEMDSWARSEGAPLVKFDMYAIGWKAGALPFALNCLSNKREVTTGFWHWFLIDGTPRQLNKMRKYQLDLLHLGVSLADAAWMPSLPDGEQKITVDQFVSLVCGRKTFNEGLKQKKPKVKYNCKAKKSNKASKKGNNKRSNGNQSSKKGNKGTNVSKK